jgi:hypothetical protein
MSPDSHPDNVAARLSAEFEALERRLVEENPGVQAVIDTYALAQTAKHHLDSYARVVTVRPITRTSNGSA